MIGIFGGTFDPVHYGHLRSAVEVKEYFGLSELRLLPSAQPPHRDQPSVSAQMRLQMLHLAIKDQQGLIIDSRELARAGWSYMVDTLQSLRQDFPEQALLLFMGMDAFNNLTSWHQWQQLFAFAHVVVMTRPGYQTPALDSFLSAKYTEQKHKLTEQAAGCLYFLPVTPLDISATAIRTIFAEKRNASFLLPEPVIQYINQHGLYQQG
ncbi:MAG: nicotinate-nucleotide adenylyltransferase [Methylococcales bacterium]